MERHAIVLFLRHSCNPNAAGGTVAHRWQREPADSNQQDDPWVRAAICGFILLPPQWSTSITHCVRIRAIRVIRGQLRCSPRPGPTDGNLVPPTKPALQRRRIHLLAKQWLGSIARSLVGGTIHRTHVSRRRMPSDVFQSREEVTPAS